MDPKQGGMVFGCNCRFYKSLYSLEPGTVLLCKYIYEQSSREVEAFEPGEKSGGQVVVLDDPWVVIGASNPVEPNNGGFKFKVETVRYALLACYDSKEKHLGTDLQPLAHYSGAETVISKDIVMKNGMFYDGALALLPADVPLFGESVYCLTNRAAANVELFTEFSFRREGITWLQLSLFDALEDLFRDLVVEWYFALFIKLEIGKYHGAAL